MLIPPVKIFSLMKISNPANSASDVQFDMLMPINETEFTFVSLFAIPFSIHPAPYMGMVSVLATIDISNVTVLLGGTINMFEEFSFIEFVVVKYVVPLL